MPRSTPFAALTTCALVCGACGLQPGERFGRPGTEPGVLRIQIPEDAGELDPARARTGIERALARQLFSALVEVRDGAAHPSLASSWELHDDRIVFHLRGDARFSDGTPLDAHGVLWSWRRALRPSTKAADLAPLAVVNDGAAIAGGRLLRVSHDGVRGRPAPFPIYRDGPGDAVGDVDIPAGTPVHVVDSNEREPCCGAAVPLHTAASASSPAPAALLAGETALVVAAREMKHGSSVRTMLRLRSPGGASGWADASDVKAHVPPIDLVPVVDRGGVAPTLRAGPDDGAPARATLGDEDIVEMVERGPDHCLVIDEKSGRTGWIATANLEDTVRERRFFLVEPDGGGPRAWLPEQDLAFDPGLLDARALDDRTLEVVLAPGVAAKAALASFAEPVMRPVPARAVEEDGRAWIDGDLPTSGPFVLAAHDPGARIVLRRSSTSAEKGRAQLDRVELLVVTRQTTALHLYRAGAVDVLLDGALPADLAPTLARAADFVAGPGGGGLVAPEVRGFSPSSLELRDVSVDGGGS